MELKDLRTALFGFNKNDVCEYISQLNTIYEQKEEQKTIEQKEILAELNRKNEELSNVAAGLNQENTELKRKNDELLNRVNLFDTEKQEIKNRIEQMQMSVVSMFEDIKEQLNSDKEQISDLQPESEE